MTRLPVEKTLKMYVDGRFVRPESGRVERTVIGGRPVNVPRASRKDLRDAVRAARAAQPGWDAATALLRGQVLYRLAEMLEGRGAPPELCDRAVFHAGWADKIGAVLSSVGSVAAPYLNYSRVRPVGVVAASAASGLGLVEAACASAVMGDACVLLADPALAHDAAVLAEALATCDLPAGVVNVLTGPVPELLVEAARHDDVDLVLIVGGVAPEVRADVARAGARSIQRLVELDPTRPATPAELQRLAEVQTVWVSAPTPRGSAGAY